MCQDNGSAAHRQHLYELYLCLLGEGRSVVTDAEKAVLKHIAFSMTEECALEQCSRIERAADRAGRPWTAAPCC